MIDSFWMEACSSVRSLVRSMTLMSGPEFSQLLSNVAERFCLQPPPASQDELNFRQNQRISVSNMLSAIGTKESMARLNPAAAQELYDLAKEMSERPLPMTQDECNQVPLEAIAFSTRASTICNKYIR